MSGTVDVRSGPAGVSVSAAVADGGRTFLERRRTADRVFRGALAFNSALTAFWLFLLLTGGSSYFFDQYTADMAALGRVAGGVLFFYVGWGFVWYGIKAALLRYWVGFSREEIRDAFSSRMHQPYEVEALTGKHSERRIRITDMIGRRGRFITLATAVFYYLYLQISSEPRSDFWQFVLADNLFDAIAVSWIFLGFFYADNLVAGAFYGPQSRVMDGVLARANCLLISSLWTAFKFVMVPVGAQLAALFPPDQFAVLFALIWGSYIAADALAEVGGSLFGKQRIRVRGIGDVNRKSIGGTVTGFAGCLVFCLLVIQSSGLPAPWYVLAGVIAVSNTVLELYSPRGTDDFTMATGNALICLAFGVLMN